MDHLGASLDRVPVNGGQLLSTTATVTATVELFHSPGGETLSNQVAGNVKSEGSAVPVLTFSPPSANAGMVRKRNIQSVID